MRFLCSAELVGSQLAYAVSWLHGCAIPFLEKKNAAVLGREKYLAHQSMVVSGSPKRW